MMIVHDCNNEVCQLLNPCMEELLPYSEVVRRVSEVERYTHTALKNLKNSKNVDKLMAGPFDLFDWSNRHMIYQIPNEEFVANLARHIKEIDANTILEIGAGRGIISKFVSKILGKKIILTDSYEWWENENRMKDLEYSNVLKKTYIEAIEEFRPDLIIASWIPFGECWTRDFRKYPFVKGYILIGEGRGGATGCLEDWETDWNMQDWDDVSKWGISKTDHGFYMENSMFALKHTDVTYFERP